MFSLAKIEFQNTPEKNLQNLKILWNSLIRYYREQMGQDLDFDEIDLTAIAKDCHIGQIVALSDIVLGAVL
jgi:hypothetical protein